MILIKTIVLSFSLAVGAHFLANADIVFPAVILGLFAVFVLIGGLILTAVGE